MRVEKRLAVLEKALQREANWWGEILVSRLAIQCDPAVIGRLRSQGPSGRAGRSSFWYKRDVDWGRWTRGW